MKKTIKVLIVEDEIAQRETLKEYLSLEEGAFEIYLASNGMEALNGLDQINPDVIILDIQMPEMDGFTFLTKLPIVYNEIAPILIITAASKEYSVIRLIKTLGADDYLSKPYKLGDLKVSIYTQLEKRQKLIAFLQKKPKN